GAEVLGPVPDERSAADYGPGGERPEADAPDAPVRALIRTPRAQGSALARALQAAQGARSPRKDAGLARVQLDPAELI
ncbi:MAG TPA: primosome assembly protein PriA, partial [Streptosporangiaceae bacterium]